MLTVEQSGRDMGRLEFHGGSVSKDDFFESDDDRFGYVERQVVLYAVLLRDEVVYMRGKAARHLGDDEVYPGYLRKRGPRKISRSALGHLRRPFEDKFCQAREIQRALLELR